MEKIRVLEVSKSTGGLGTYMRWLARGLDPARFDLTFVCLSEGGAELAEELARLPGITTVHWPMNRFKINILSDARILLRLMQIIRQKKIDIVHGHGSKAGFMVRLAALGTRTRTAYSPHGFSFHARQRPILAALYATVERITASLLTTRIITVSDGEREEARQHGLRTEKKFVTVHSGIEAGMFGMPVDKAALRASLDIPAEAFLVGTVGRLDEQKAPLDFVRVAAQVRAQYPSTHFLWIGDGYLAAAAKTLARELGVEAAIIFAGQRSDVPQLLSAMDCFLLTSHWEAFPIVILEAMATRIPVVATALPGTQEALRHSQEGLIAPVGDINALSAAIPQVLTDPALAVRLGAQARERIEQEFTRGQMIMNLMRVYEELTHGDIR